MKMTDHHIQALDDLLTWRRDVRHFRPDPLPQDVIDTLRRAMDKAPSVGNARPWRVFQVSSDRHRADIREEFLRCNAEAAAQYQGEDRTAYERLKLAGLDNAPLQLAVFTDTAPPEGKGLGRKTMPQTLEQSTCMAMYGMWLTARAMNLGIGMLSILDPKRVESLFQTPDTWRFSAYLCIGYPEFDDDTPLLHRKGWQENTPTRWETR